MGVRRILGVGLVVALVAVWSGTAEAAPPGTSVVVRVVDESGAVQPASGAVACPFEGGDRCDDPTHAIDAKANKAGYAVLRLAAGERYELRGYVTQPSPPWSCPGSPFRGREVHWSVDGNLNGVTATEIDTRHTFVVRHPGANDCIPVHVEDDLGTPLPTAGLFVCPLAADGTTCEGGQSFDGPDADGTIRLAVDPAVTYRLGAYLANSGWPCPQYEAPDGTLFHFSPSTDIVGADLIADGLTLVIHHPVASECPVDNATVRVVDDLGDPVPTAGLFVCPLEADGSGCPQNQSFDGPDADGFIHLVADPTVTYRLGAFVANSGWPCPQYKSPDGTLFHFSSSTDIVGADLIADGLTLVIHHPVASECPTDNATVRVVDDLGNPLPTAGLFVCPLEADGSGCPQNQSFDGPDADGLIHLVADPAVTYRLGAFLANSGWPCPAYQSPDGTWFHFSPSTDILGADLIDDGLTLVIHHPTESECP
jgi:hypothetical protein